MKRALLLERFRAARRGYVDEDGRAVDVEYIDFYGYDTVDALVAIAAFEAALPRPFARVLAYGTVDVGTFVIVSEGNVVDALRFLRHGRPPPGIPVCAARRCLWGAEVLEDARQLDPAGLRWATVGEVGFVDDGVVLRRPLARPDARLRTRLRLITPEMVRGLPVTPAAHQFTVASLLTEWITRRLTFGALGQLGIMEAVGAGTPVPPLRGRIHDDALLAVVERMLARDADQRYPSCADARAALQPFAVDDDALRSWLLAQRP
ncbi:MAG: hypothetical protein Q8O67_16650 [Deltaproteobacteria bacterium]|nr:hypothetical protein [Deltaproteobacteria bacterium]